MDSADSQLKERIVQVIEKRPEEDEVFIGVLRYGAHIPHLYNRIARSPRRIKLILSNMLDFFPPEYYQSKSFCILDDTVYEGREMKRIYSKLTEGCGVAPAKIRQDALVIRNDCKMPLEPDTPRLDEPNYIVWKEQLTNLITKDIRPTERDHPLYYFQMERLRFETFLSLLEEFGCVHNVHGDSSVGTSRVTLTLDSAVLGDMSVFGGVELGEICKVRFYWEETIDGCNLTSVPIVFPQFAPAEFSPLDGERLAALLELPSRFFSNLRGIGTLEASQRMLFYFVSRAIAAVLLERLLAQVVPLLKSRGATIRSVPPEIIDDRIHYEFPREYLEFHGNVYKQLEHVVNSALSDDRLPLTDNWGKPEIETEIAATDAVLPVESRLLEFVVRDGSPVVLKGDRWTAKSREEGPRGKSIKEMIEEFGSAVFVSKALDDLLDCGLLRSFDDFLDASHGHGLTRLFLVGGEYKAVQVARMVESWKSARNPVPESFIGEDSVELWGAF